MLCGNGSLKKSDNDARESKSYTCTLDKAYRFFQDGHVQNIRFHPMPNQPGCICIFNLMPTRWTCIHSAGKTIAYHVAMDKYHLVTFTL